MSESREPLAVPPSETIFAKIARGEVPVSKVVYQDDDVIAFHDMHPQAPTHVLIIPKKLQGVGQVHNCSEVDAESLGKLLVAAGKVAKQLNLEKRGYRLVMNQGLDAEQYVNYLHLHLLAGRHMQWPPG